MRRLEFFDVHVYVDDLYDLVMRGRYSIRSLGQEDARPGSPPESPTARSVTNCPRYETVSAFEL